MHHSFIKGSNSGPPLNPELHISNKHRNSSISWQEGGLFQTDGIPGGDAKIVSKQIGLNIDMITESGHL